MRDSRYDILKALAIIIMVANHAYAPRCIAAFGSMFHMAVFFILAGWFFSPRHCESFRGCFDYWKQRMIRLWWPCVFWSVVFILLRNTLASNHLIHDLSFWDIAPAGYETPLWTRSEILRQLAYAPLMLANATPLAGAFWFLQTLLYASVGYCVANWILKSVKLPALAIQTILSIVFFIWSMKFDCKPLAAIGGPHTLVAYALIHLGVLLRNYNLNINRLTTPQTILVGIGCFVGLAIMSRFGTISLAINKYPNPLFLFVASILGWYFLVIVSSLFHGRTAKCLAYIGSHTMPILILHYAAFKVVNVVLALVHNAEFPSVANVVAHRGGGYWILYAAAGIGFPIALDACYRLIRSIAFSQPVQS